MLTKNEILNVLNETIATTDIFDSDGFIVNDEFKQTFIEELNKAIPNNIKNKDGLIDFLKKNFYEFEISKDGYKITILGTLEGNLDYFFKSGKLLIRNQNKWVKEGLKWLNQKL